MSSRWDAAPAATALALAWIVSTAPALAAESPDLSTASEEQKQRAQEQYGEAMEHFEAARLEPALEGFRTSYGTVRSPNSHFMIARTLARLGRNAEAYAELERVVEEAEAMGEWYADTAQAARAKQSDIRPRIGLVKIRLLNFPKGTKLQVEGSDLDLKELDDPVPVLPGSIQVIATAPGAKPVERTVEVETGGEAELVLEPPPDVKPPPPPKPPEPAHVEREGAHPRYFVELELHAMATTIEPPGPANGGWGPGARLTVPILPEGFLSGVNDSLAIGLGADWVATSEDPHVTMPLVGQWNVWLAPRLSLFAELGGALMLGAGEHVLPDVSLGGRYELIADRLAVTLRLGLPLASAGFSLML